MKKVSIFEKRWIDLVFEGKNKAYGAYQLRQENPKTTLVAFLYGLLFIASVSGFGLLLSSFDKPENIDPVPNEPTIHVVTVYTEHPPIKKVEPLVTEKPETKSLKKVIKDPEIVKNGGDDIAKNADLPKTPVVEGTPAGTGKPTDIIPTGGTGGGKPTDGGKDSGIKTTVMLDKQPNFPGGMDGFYRFVANNFKSPEEELDTTLKVYVSFVIEIDGSLSNIRVIKDPGYGIGTEAIRVLKSLKTKWEPGVLDGEKVRTAYNLPIAVKVD